MKKFVLILLMLTFGQTKAQPVSCTLKQPLISIHFGTGDISDVNINVPENFTRRKGYCPNDGYYAYTDYTRDCFNSHWFTLTEDHTAGDLSGNMMLVNAAYTPGTFLRTTLTGLKSGTTYELALWLINVCKISSYCPSLLLPNVTVLLQTPAGKTVAKFSTGELRRTEEPDWNRFYAFFSAPPTVTALNLIMLNTNPGGCGNDFALDDITLRECIHAASPVTTAPKIRVSAKNKTTILKPAAKREKISPVKSRQPVQSVLPAGNDSPIYVPPALKLRSPVLPPPPLILTKRENSVVKKIETEAGEIEVSLYDNGEIDGDTVSVYHNNVLLIAHARLSQKPVAIRLSIDTAHRHHELIMVAENLGTIPPNTSLMIITAGTKRYEVFISSNELKNAKVIFDLKE